MDLSKVAEYRNKIAAIEKKEKKINEDKITLKAQIDQSSKLRDEKIVELKTLGVEYVNCDNYITTKEQEIKDIEQQIEDILAGKTTENTTTTTEVTSTIEESDIDLEPENILEEPNPELESDNFEFGDMPF